MSRPLMRAISADATFLRRAPEITRQCFAAVVGVRVLVCENMAFNGDFEPVLAKHSKHRRAPGAETPSARRGAPDGGTHASPISYHTHTGSAQIDCSRTGTLLYRSGGDENELMTVHWLDATGKTQPLLSKPGEYVHTAVSPDGQRLAMAVAEGPNLDISVHDRQGETNSRLTSDGGTR